MTVGVWIHVCKRYGLNTMFVLLQCFLCKDEKLLNRMYHEKLQMSIEL